MGHLSRISSDVIKRLEALDEKKAMEKQMADMKLTNGEIREKIEKNRILLNETMRETGTANNNNSENEDENNKTEADRIAEERKRIREVIDEFVLLEKRLDGESTRKRMSLMEDLLEKNLKNTLPIMLETLYGLLEKIRMRIEKDGTEKCEDKVVQIINILTQVTMKHARMRDIQLSEKKSPTEQSYGNFPHLLEEFRASDKLSDGIDILIRALHVNNRMSRYQLSQQILPEMVAHCDDKLIKHRKDKEIGELVSIALSLACETLENKERQKKSTTTREKATLAFITKFIPRKK